MSISLISTWMKRVCVPLVIIYLDTTCLCGSSVDDDVEEDDDDDDDDDCSYYYG